MFDRRLRTRWWRLCLPSLALTTLLVGCAMPGKDSQKGARLVTNASYQELSAEENTPKKIRDPLSLKLRYARWMEELENFEEAQANYSIVLEERPEDVEAILGLARIDQVAGRFDAAGTGVRKALELRRDSATAMSALGQHYVARERLPEALPLLNKAMLTDPANKVYRFHLAVALAKSGDATAAYPHFVQSVGEPTAHYNLGMILKTQGRYAQAEEHLLQAVTKKPDFDAAKQALTLVRQQAQAMGTYASQPQPVDQIRRTGHSRPATPSSASPHRLPSRR